MRRCPKCKKELDESSFSKDSRRKDGLQLWCNKCGLENKKKNYYDHAKESVKLSSRRTAIKHNYGITLEEYNNLLNSQNGRCAICDKMETQSSCKNGTIDSLRVDHDHKTGKIRGLLCSKCNFALGHFNDDIELLNKAIKYLLLEDLKNGKE
jgi:hypothetical protein